MFIDKTKNFDFPNQTISKTSNDNMNANDQSNKTETISLITREAYYFKNEILKELSQIEQRLNSKLSLNNIEMTNNKKDFETKLKLLNIKIESISDNNCDYDSFKEKMDELIRYKVKNEETQMVNKIKIDDIKQEIKNSFNKYDKLIKKHMIPDGLVGESCQFKTFPEMIRFILDGMSNLNTFKERNNIDLKSYKVKLESLIATFKTQLENIIKNMTQFTNKSVYDSEQKMKGMINLYDERLIELRVENNNYIKNLTDKYENLIKEWDRTLELRKEIYNKIDSDIQNVNDLINNKSKEHKNELDKFNIKYLKIKEEIAKLKVSIQNTRERQINYSKNINSKQKRAFDEDYLYSYKKSNKRFSLDLDDKETDKWKKYVENSFNKVMEKSNLDKENKSKDSNIYKIDINENKLRNTLSYSDLGLKNNNNNSLIENKFLNIKNNFESINEEENEINTEKINIVNDENNEKEDNKINDDEKMDLLSNKTNDNINENEKRKDKQEHLNNVINIEKEKQETNNISFNNKINDKKNNEINNDNNIKKHNINKKNNDISNLNRIKRNNKLDKSVQIEENKLEKVNSHITFNDNDNSTSIKLVKDKNKVKNISISKEIHSSEIEFPKIDYFKKSIPTDQDPEDKIINKINKKFQKARQSSDVSFSAKRQGEHSYSKKVKNILITASQIDNSNDYSYKSNYKMMNNKYYFAYVEKLKERKNLSLKKHKDYISEQEIIFDPFKNMKIKLHKSKSSKDNLISNLSYNKINNYHVNSAKKIKEDNISYRNSKGELNNIIHIPPPSNSFYKNLFGIA